MHTVSQQQLIIEVAKDLKEHIHKPEWADYVKTGVHKQRPPADEDWWFVRAAAVLRTVNLKGPVGVSKLRTKYGGLKNRGVKPNAFRKGSGSILRHVLQGLEQAGFIKQEARGTHKGRVITPAGASILFKAAKRIKPVKAKKSVAKAKTTDKKSKTAEKKPKTETVEKKSDVKASEDKG